MPRVALATCSALPDLDPDEALVLAPLRSRGVEAEAAVWDDPHVDWDSFDATLVRCTWDYQDRRDEFVDWARRTPRLHNCAEIVEWNTDKRYMRDLETAGVPVVPTAWLPPGDEVRLPETGEWVLKPSIGAGSRGAGRFQLDRADHYELALSLVEGLHASGRTVMAQPYQVEVDVAGEKALLYAGGDYSHAINKAALLDGPAGPDDVEFYKAERISPAEATAAECELAEATLKAVPGGADQLLYARVDVVGEGDAVRVLELEVAEPSMFYGHAPGSAERMADAVAGLF
ncbi:MAG: ATP-grasp domain-containing protein [Stackebrandtia sp.]